MVGGWWLVTYSGPDLEVVNECQWGTIDTLVLRALPGECLHSRIAIAHNPRVLVHK